VEVEMELLDDRYRHEADHSFWLRAAESVELAAALTLGAKMCDEALETT
jgi:hypothetical protein